MNAQKTYLGFILGIIFQLVAVLIFYFFGLNFSSLVIMLLGSLAIILTIGEVKKIKRIYLLGLLATLLGLIFSGIFILLGLFTKIVLLLIVIYSVLFFLFVLDFPLKNYNKNVYFKNLSKKNISNLKKSNNNFEKLPETSMEKIKIGDEAEKIFKEIEKLEQEIKKQNNKEKKIGVKNKSYASRVSNTKFQKIKQENQKYASVKNGKTFHLSSCTMLLRQDSKKYVHYDSRSKALASGLRPCRVCNP